MACAACGAGTYKTGEGTGTCSPCEAGTYAPFAGQDDVFEYEKDDIEDNYCCYFVPCGRCTILKYELLCDVTVWS